MKRTRANRGSANVGCIVWLVILAFVGYVLYKVVPVKIASSEFYDVMQEQAAFGSIKDIKFIEFEILRKAEELHLPIKKDNLKITRGREAITVEAHYEIPIDFFNGTYVYVWKFDQIVGAASGGTEEGECLPGLCSKYRLTVKLPEADSRFYRNHLATLTFHCSAPVFLSSATR